VFGAYLEDRVGGGVKESGRGEGYNNWNFYATPFENFTPLLSGLLPSQVPPLVPV